MVKYLTGVITKGIGGFYYVRAEDGKTYECRARGIFRKQGTKPMIGDFVTIELNGEQGSITEIGERKNALIRPSVANIDMLVLVSATKSPEANPYFLDKMLVIAERQGISPVLCFNKEDLESGHALETIYRSAGYPIFRTSAETGEGVEELRTLIRGKTTAFAGLSGVGKSSLLTLLTSTELETGSVSERLQRGKHTTRHVELFPLPEGGFVLDTPGFSSLVPENFPPEELFWCFPEMRNVGECRFRGCSHISEPDCAVKKKLSEGGISPSRYESYCALYSALKEHKDWE